MILGALNLLKNLQGVTVIVFDEFGCGRSEAVCSINLKNNIYNILTLFYKNVYFNLRLLDLVFILYDLLFYSLQIYQKNVT